MPATGAQRDQHSDEFSEQADHLAEELRTPRAQGDSLLNAIDEMLSATSAEADDAAQEEVENLGRQIDALLQTPPKSADAPSPQNGEGESPMGAWSIEALDTELASVAAELDGDFESADGAIETAELDSSEPDSTDGDAAPTTATDDAPRRTDALADELAEAQANQSDEPETGLDAETEDAAVVAEPLDEALTDAPAPPAPDAAASPTAEPASDDADLQPDAQPEAQPDAELEEDFEPAPVPPPQAKPAAQPVVEPAAAPIAQPAAQPVDKPKAAPAEPAPSFVGSPAAAPTPSRAVPAKPKRTGPSPARRVLTLALTQTKRVASLASAPLEGRPRIIRDSIGWIAIWTAFLAVCTLMAVVVFRKARTPDVQTTPEVLSAEPDNGGWQIHTPGNP